VTTCPSVVSTKFAVAVTGMKDVIVVGLVAPFEPSDRLKSLVRLIINPDVQWINSLAIRNVLPTGVI
jgi:hypothetical protein